MLEEKQQLPNSADLSDNARGEGPAPDGDVKELRQTAEDVLKDYKPSLEKALVSRWQSGTGEPEPSEGHSEPSEPISGEVASPSQPQAEGEKMLPQEREALSRQKRLDQYAPPPPPPTTLSSLPAESPSGEFIPQQGKLLKIVLNVFIIVLVVGGAAVAGYWYTNRNLAPTTSVGPETPGAIPVETVPQPESTPPKTPPTPETPAVEPVSAWLRLKNKSLGLSVEHPQNWFIYPEDAATTSETVIVSSKALSSPPTSMAEAQVASPDFLVGIGLLDDGKKPRVTLEEYLRESHNLDSLEEVMVGNIPGLRRYNESADQVDYYVSDVSKIFFVSIKPKNYLPEYTQVAEKILGSLLFYSPVEATPTKDYVNTIDNYSLKYPEGWQDKGLSSSELGLFKTFANDTETFTLSLGFLKEANLESFAGKPADSSYFEYLLGQSDGVERSSDSKYRITKLGEIAIGGSKAVKQRELAGNEFNVAYYVLHNGKVLRILATLPSEAVWLNYEEAVETVLGTLKFQ